MGERERLIEMLKVPIYPKEGVDPAEVVADYLLDNGVIVPPVRVGDVVYYIYGGYYREPKNCKVSRPCKVVEVSLKRQRNGSAIMRGFITDNGTRYNFDSIGKTVFLTQEGAERDLERRKNDD